MKAKHQFLAALLFLGFQQIRGQHSTENSFGKGLVNMVAKDSSYSIKLGMRFQSLFTSQWDVPSDGGIGSGETNFLIRRARLKFNGFAYSPKLTYKLQLGLSNRDNSGASPFSENAPHYIMDAVLKWNFYKNFELWAGQTKLPGNRESLISSGDLETVDRSLLNSRFKIERDMGIQLRHSFLLGSQFLVREALAFSQGEGRNITSGNLGGYQTTLRAEVLPFGDFAAYSGGDLIREATPKLALGVSYDINTNAVRTRSNSGSFMINDSGLFETDIKTLFLDVMFKFRGLSLMSEYAKRNSEDPVAKNSDGTPTGAVVNLGDAFNFQASYLFGNNYQVVGRFTTVDQEAALLDNLENQYTLGFSKYLVGHKLKIQTDLNYTDRSPNPNDGLLYRLQFDIHF